MTALPIQAVIGATMFAVYDGRICIGFILPRGTTGFEAFTLEEKSLGLFKSEGKAANAIEEARR
jgi:hypothetical protein